MKTVILTVDVVDKRALVIVYPLAMSSKSSKKAISLAPFIKPPKMGKGPVPLMAYLAQVTELSSTPDQCMTADRVKSRYVQWYSCLVFSSSPHRKIASNKKV
jgi:hypothetical protein